MGLFIFTQVQGIKMQGRNDNDSVLAIEISNDGAADVVPDTENCPRDGGQRKGGEM